MTKKDCLACQAEGDGATGVIVALVYAKTYGLEEVRRRMCEPHQAGLKAAEVYKAAEQKALRS